MTVSFFSLALAFMAGVLVGAIVLTVIAIALVDSDYR